MQTDWGRFQILECSTHLSTHSHTHTHTHTHTHLQVPTLTRISVYTPPGFKTLSSKRLISQSWLGALVLTGLARESHQWQACENRYVDNWSDKESKEIFCVCCFWAHVYTSTLACIPLPSSGTAARCQRIRFTSFFVVDWRWKCSKTCTSLWLTDVPRRHPSPESDCSVVRRAR